MTDLQAMLTPDAFTCAMQAVVDILQTRSNLRVYGVPDPQKWCDEFRLRRPGSTAQQVESLLVEAIKYCRQRNGKAKARYYINLAKYMLINY